MNLKKTLAAAALGAGMSAVMLPGIAFADTTASPSVVSAGETVSVWASCSPGVTGESEIIGPGKMQTFNITLNSASDGARGTFTAPGGTASYGTWNVTSTCGGAAAGSTTFTVAPGGGPKGGDGGSGGGTLLATAIALLGAAAAGMYVLKRRTTKGTTPA